MKGIKSPRSKNNGKHPHLNTSIPPIAINPRGPEPIVMRDGMMSPTPSKRMAGLKPFSSSGTQYSGGFIKGPRNKSVGPK